MYRDLDSKKTNHFQFSVPGLQEIHRNLKQQKNFNSRDGFFRKSPFCTFSCINPGFGGPWGMLWIFFSYWHEFVQKYYKSNLLFIFQIFWYLTFSWFLFQACDVRGSANTTTTVDSNSGSLKNETCKCKNFVKGEFCNECKEGYWNLTQINPDGCQSK